MTPHEFFARVWEMFMGRADGPFTLRLFLQPTMATIFAIRAGVRDAREGRAPFFFWAIFSNAERRSEMFGRVRKDVGKVFVVALLLDVVYELKVYHWIYPGQAVIIATLLAIVPYLLICGPIGRLTKQFYGSSTPK